MKRLLKWIGALLAFCVLAFMVAVIAVTLLLDPNQFKPLITSQFKQFTGYEITIPGNLSWSFFPHLGMKAEEVTVSNAPDFSSTIHHLILRVRIRPLLHRQVEFSKVSIETLQFNQLQATALDAKIRFKNQVLSIQPLTADFYQGELHSDTTISFTEASPHIHLLGELKNVDLASLIKGLSAKPSKLSFEGRGEVTLDADSQGKKIDEILKQLNGTGSLHVDKGILKGIDLAFYVDTAIALINKQPLPARLAGNQTEFGQLTGTAVIKNGILENSDLLVESPLFTTKGKGTIDLVNKTLDFHLEVTPKLGQTNNAILTLAGKTVPIHVSGSLNDPTVSLDTLDLMQEIGKEQLQKMEEQIQKALPEKANKFIQNLFH